MVENRLQPGTANQMATALARWDEEGGAPAVPWPLRRDLDHLPAMERRILESLGAALVGEWHNLPTDTQRAIFHRAATERAPDPEELKARIARFLHDHKGSCAAS